MVKSIARLEDHGKTGIVRFEPGNSLYVADIEAMVGLWQTFDKLHGKQVVLFQMPRDFLATSKVDDFLRQAKNAPVDPSSRGGRLVPRMVAVADTSLKRTMTFMKSIHSLTIGAFEGEIDFDLLGLVLACKYRLCSSDTTFVNRSLRRDAAPGAGTPWFLARLLGYAKARRLYLDEVSLSADDALELGIVDRISEANCLGQDSLEVARRFEGYDRQAVSSMMKAMDLVELDLSTYIEQTVPGS